MQPDRWQQVERLYHEAQAHVPGERVAFLSRACGDDRELRHEVERLLAADEQAGSFLALPPMEMAARGMGADDARGPAASVWADVTGQTISHYKIRERLGEGGMGVVYRALDTRLNRPVAIKVLSHAAMADAERSRRFVQEARAASALNHPHIITVYEIDAWSGVDFIAMEYVEGTTLERLIGRKGLKLREVLKYAAQIADALAAAHKVGIVHRDLKPANVMITGRGDAKVLDFGLAKLAERPDGDPSGTHSFRAAVTEAGVILGTVAYMSPEQAEGKTCDARSDVFSFGSLAYEMATGRRAFEGDTKVSTLAAILHHEPQPFSDVAPGIPRELERIIAHCLRKDPDRRFQHLDDVKTLLEQLKEDSESGTLDAARRHESTEARKWLLPVALAALLVVGGGAWWLIHNRAPGPAPGSITRSDAETIAATPPVTASRPRLSSGGPASTNPEANRYFENAMQSKVINDLPRQRQMLERALALDPRFAEARAWYGYTNWLMLDQGYSNDATLLYRAEDDMRRALQDEPNLARAHAGFAAVYITQGRTELVPGEVELALESNPGDEDALSTLIIYHQYREEYAAAQRAGRQVLDRIPLFFPARMELAEMVRQQGNPAAAIREQERILEQDPHNVYALSYLARTHLDSGDIVKARQTLDRVRAGEERESFRVRRTRAILLALEGRRAEALAEMDEETLKWEGLIAYETSEAADFYAVLGDTSRALDWLDRTVRNGDERVEYFRRDPLLANIRHHPRFQHILESIAYRRQQRQAVR